MPSTFTPVRELSGFRRVAAAMWDAPSDPTIYGFMDLDATETLAAIERARAALGVRLTVTHVVAHAVARAFSAYPALNAKVRRSGRLERRSNVDLVISVATDGGADLSAARIERAEELDLLGVESAIRAQVDRTRHGDGGEMNKGRDMLRKLPTWLVRPTIKLSDYVGNELGWHLPSLGIPRDPFGTAVITNVGMFGIDTAFAPFVPIGRAPLLLLVTEVRERPWAEDGVVTARPVLRLCASFDHRIIDGFQAGKLASVIRREVEAPQVSETATRREVAP